MENIFDCSDCLACQKAAAGKPRQKILDIAETLLGEVLETVLGNTKVFYKYLFNTISNRNKLDRFQCKICEFISRTRQKMLWHGLSIHGFYTQEKNELKSETHFSMFSNRRNKNLTQNTMFECKYCEKTYALKINMINHIETKHKNSTSQQQRETTDISVTTKNKPFHTFQSHRCIQCDLNMSTINQMKVHIKQEHGGKMRNTTYCKVCSIQYHHKKRFKNHKCVIKKLKVEKDSSNTEPNQNIETPNAIIKKESTFAINKNKIQKIISDNHDHEHTRISVFTKDIKQPFENGLYIATTLVKEVVENSLGRTNLNYRYMTNVIKNSKRFACMNCNFNSRTKQKMVWHGLNTHGFWTAEKETMKPLKFFAKGKQFECKSCDHISSNKLDMIRHIKSLHDCSNPSQQEKQTNSKDYKVSKGTKRLNRETTYQCLLCDLNFGTKKTIKIHIKHKHRLQKNKKNNVCTVCSKEFFRKKTFESHKCVIQILKREASGMRDNVQPAPTTNSTFNKNTTCIICMKYFPHTQSLVNHKLKHDKQKLKSDKIMPHTNKRNNICKICFEAFHRKKTLEIHENNVHKFNHHTNQPSNTQPVSIANEVKMEFKNLDLEHSVMNELILAGDITKEEGLIDKASDNKGCELEEGEI